MQCSTQDTQTRDIMMQHMHGGCGGYGDVGGTARHGHSPLSPSHSSIPAEHPSRCDPQLHRSHVAPPPHIPHVAQLHRSHVAPQALQWGCTWVTCGTAPQVTGHMWHLTILGTGTTTACGTALWQHTQARLPPSVPTWHHSTHKPHRLPQSQHGIVYASPALAPSAHLPQLQAPLAISRGDQGPRAQKTTAAHSAIGPEGFGYGIWEAAHGAHRRDIRGCTWGAQEGYARLHMGRTGTPGARGGDNRAHGRCMECTHRGHRRGTHAEIARSQRMATLSWRGDSSSVRSVRAPRSHAVTRRLPLPYLQEEGVGEGPPRA